MPGEKSLTEKEKIEARLQTLKDLERNLELNLVSIRGAIRELEMILVPGYNPSAINPLPPPPLPALTEEKKKG